MAKKIPPVMLGIHIAFYGYIYVILLYSYWTTVYLPSRRYRKSVNWSWSILCSSTWIQSLGIWPSKSSCKHLLFCHVRCSMTPSMKSEVYHVFILLLAVEGKVGSIKKNVTYECATGYLLYVSLNFEHNLIYNLFNCR